MNVCHLYAQKEEVKENETLRFRKFINGVLCIEKEKYLNVITAFFQISQSFFKLFNYFHEFMLFSKRSTTVVNFNLCKIFH